MRGAELIRYSLRSIDELEEEDRCNREVRLITEHAEAVTSGNDVFDPESLNRLLSGILGSTDRTIKAVYYNTLGS